MGDKRKQMLEVEQITRKIQNGCCEFDELLEKAQHALPEKQKLMMDHDIKREIKKLQRNREALKKYLNQPEFVAKYDLEKVKKEVELKMDLYRRFEKEAKTKNYSNESLMHGGKRDREQTLKVEFSMWVNRTVKQVQQYVHANEADLEKIPVDRKKRKARENEEARSKLETKNKELTRLSKNLEIFLRLIHNEMIPMEKCEGVRDSIDFYLECLTAQEATTNPDEVFAEFNLDDIKINELPSINSAELLASKQSEKTDKRKSAPAPSNLNTTNNTNNNTNNTNNNSNKAQSKQAAEHHHQEEHEGQKGARPQQHSTVSPTQNSSSSATNHQANTNRHSASPVSASVFHEEYDRSSPRATVSGNNNTNNNNNQNTTFKSRKSSEAQQTIIEPNPSHMLSSIEDAGVREAVKKFMTQELFSETDEKTKKRQERFVELTDVNNQLENSRMLNSTVTGHSTLFSTQYRQSKHHVHNVKSCLLEQEFYKKAPLEMLFFVFYFMVGTKIQQMAAQELKRKNWFFNNRTRYWYVHGQGQTMADALTSTGGSAHRDLLQDQNTVRCVMSYFNYKTWSKSTTGEGFTFSLSDIENNY